MVDRQEIIHLYRSGTMSKRAIAKHKGISRATVDKIIASYEAALSADSQEALEDLLTLQPAYNAQGRKPRRLTSMIVNEIDNLLEINQQQLRKGLRKQTMRKVDIYQALVSKGVQISYSSVCNYVRLKTSKEKDTKAFIRQEYAPGNECEFDWGDVKLYIGGRMCRLYLAVFTLCHSNLRRSFLFSRQDTLSFMESHRSFFKDVDGVPRIMVYDNMRVAVKKFVGVHEKQPTEALSRMSAFYNFDYRFCNIRAGWEKGHVERSVEYVRRKAFCIPKAFASLSEAQEYLSAVCHKMDAEVAFGCGDVREKQFNVHADICALLSKPGDIGCYEMEPYTVDKWSTVCINGSHYSVPDKLVGKTVGVKKYSDFLIMMYEKQRVARHDRIWTGRGWSLQLEHYLDTLLRKPGALSGSVALQQVPHKIKQLFEIHFKDNPKEFILVLQYALDNGFYYRDITDAAQRLFRKGLSHLSADQIKAELHANTNASFSDSPVESYNIMPDQLMQIENSAFKSIIATDSLLNPAAK
jgi:transposase